MNEIKYEYQPRDVDILKTGQLILEHHHRWPNLWFIILVLSGLLLPVSIFGMFNVEPTAGRFLLPWVLLCGFTIPYALIVIREGNRLVRLAEQSDWRQGTTQVTLSKRGISSIHPTCEMSVNWGQVSDIITDLPAGTFFILSPYDYIPCPDAALSSGMSRAQLVEQIAKWR